MTIKSLIKRIPPFKRLIQDRDQLELERDELKEEREQLIIKVKELLARIDHLEKWIQDTIRFAPPGHFYSSLPDLDEVKKDENRIFHYCPKDFPGVDLNWEKQLALLDAFHLYYEQMPFKQDKQDSLRFFFNNTAFGGGDAFFLYAFIRHFQPKRLIEVGSGNSTCLILDTNDVFFEGGISVTAIEPFPELLFSLLKEEDKTKIEVLSCRLQDVLLSRFKELEAGDILFIDSSHVSKVGSDVNYIFFDILPALQNGVVIHIHDIFAPFEYPVEWVYEGRGWNEVYLLRAFLQYNSAFEVLLFDEMLANRFREKLRTEMPLCLERTGSFWLRKK